MSNTYLAIHNQCNHRCAGCPCKISPPNSLSLSDIQDIADTLDDSSFMFFTISGGEPTLHPQIIDILRYLIQDKKAYVTILTNSDRFHEYQLVDDLAEAIDTKLNHVHIVTTFHHYLPQKHEEQNNTPGSFDRSLNGLLNLIEKGFNISIKHCITKNNYDTLDFFINFLKNTFPPSIKIQLWGFDYCGLSAQQAQKFYVSFEKIQPFLEEALDTYLKFCFNEQGWKISLNNIPLCATDPYYWHLFQFKNKTIPIYDSYYDGNKALSNVQDDSSTGSKHCQICAVQHICSGAYNTTFQYFGDDVVNAILEA